MTRYVEFINRIIHGIWRRRKLAAVISLVSMVFIAPVFIEANGIDFPVRYIFSETQSASLDAIVLLEKTVNLPGFVTWIFIVLFTLTVFLTIMAFVRIILRRHWAWIWIVFMWPLAPLYYWFGPDEQWVEPTAPTK